MQTGGDQSDDGDEAPGKYSNLKSPTDLAAMVRESTPFLYQRIPPAHPTLSTIRLTPEAINDHNLDAYRLGLGLPPKLEDHKMENIEASS